MGAADRDLGKNDLAAPEAFRRLRDDVAAFDVDLGAEPLDRHDQKVDRAGADGAAAGHGDTRFAHARDQRCDDPKTRPHLGNEIVGSGRVDDVGGGDVQRLAVVGGLAGTFAADHDVDAVVAEDALQQPDVGEPRHIVENERLLGQEARDHQR